MSLSVILPVRNAQDQLAHQLVELLEVLPDLTSRFQIIVVDDASTDHTEDVAQELAQQFPQIKVLRHAVKKGAQEAVQTGLALTEAAVVFVQQANTKISHARLSRLWMMRNDDQLELAQAMPEPKPIPRRVIDSLVRWGMNVTEMAESSAETGGVQMIRNEGSAVAQEVTEGDVPVGRISRTDEPQTGVSDAERANSNARQLRRGLARISRRSR